MRITFIIPGDDLSGGIRVVATYAEKLLARGHFVSVVAPLRRSESFFVKFKRLLRGQPAPKKHPKRESHFQRIGIAVKHAKIEQICDGSAVPNGDVVIATWWETAEWIKDLNPDKGVKHHFIQGHEVFDYTPKERVRQSYRLPFQKIVIAKWLQNLLRENYGNDQAVIVSNAVDHELFHAIPRSKQKCPTVGFVYACTTIKGMDVALRVILKLHAKYHNLRILCFGGTVPTEFYSQVPNIEFVQSPPQGSIRNLYSSCDAWLVTSRSEGFCLPAMEAMACRTPVVSTRMGWPAEAIIDGWNGMLSEVDDVEGLTRGLSTILESSDEEWRVMSDNAFRTVASANWDASAELFEKVLIENLQKVIKNTTDGFPSPADIILQS